MATQHLKDTVFVQIRKHARASIQIEIRCFRIECGRGNKKVEPLKESIFVTDSNTGGMYVKGSYKPSAMPDSANWGVGYFRLMHETAQWSLLNGNNTMTCRVAPEQADRIA